MWKQKTQLTEVDAPEHQEQEARLDPAMELPAPTAEEELEYAMAAADRYAEQSRQALAPLADSEFKRALLLVPDFVVAREK